jgi:hypothetical protein
MRAGFAGWRLVFTARADLRALADDFAYNASAHGAGSGAGVRDDRGYCTYKCAQSRRCPDAATLIRGFELFYLFVGAPVDLIELGSRVIDELGDLVHDIGHFSVQIGLVHDRHPVVHVHAVHAVDHVAGVVGVEPVSSAADALCDIGVRMCLLALSVRDVRPGIGGRRGPQASEDGRRVWPCRHARAGANRYHNETPRALQTSNGPPSVARLSVHVAVSASVAGPGRMLATYRRMSSM